MRNEFIKEINKIHNEELRVAALLMALDAPDYFWTAAASSSGKYHPTISLGEGGLLRHSIMVCNIAKDLIEAEVFIQPSDDVSVNDLNDWAIVASLFHDVIKRGEGDNTEHTVFEHPLLSAEFVRSHLTQAKINDSVINVICNAIESHMGKWNTSSRSDTVLPKPSTKFGLLIHTADYMASRKYMKGLESWEQTK